MFNSILIVYIFFTLSNSVFGNCVSPGKIGAFAESGQNIFEQSILPTNDDGIMSCLKPGRISCKDKVSLMMINRLMRCLSNKKENCPEDKRTKKEIEASLQQISASLGPGAKQALAAGLVKKALLPNVTEEGIASRQQEQEKPKPLISPELSEKFSDFIQPQFKNLQEQTKQCAETFIQKAEKRTKSIWGMVEGGLTSAFNNLSGLCKYDSFNCDQKIIDWCQEKYFNALDDFNNRYIVWLEENKENYSKEEKKALMTKVTDVTRETDRIFNSTRDAFVQGVKQGSLNYLKGTIAVGASILTLGSLGPSIGASATASTAASTTTLATITAGGLQAMQMGCIGAIQADLLIEGGAAVVKSSLEGKKEISCDRLLGLIDKSKTDNLSASDELLGLGTRLGAGCGIGALMGGVFNTLFKAGQVGLAAKYGKEAAAAYMGKVGTGIGLYFTGKEGYEAATKLSDDLNRLSEIASEQNDPELLSCIEHAMTMSTIDNTAGFAHEALDILVPIAAGKMGLGPDGGVSPKGNKGSKGTNGSPGGVPDSDLSSAPKVPSYSGGTKGDAPDIGVTSAAKGLVDSAAKGLVESSGTKAGVKKMTVFKRQNRRGYINFGALFGGGKKPKKPNRPDPIMPKPRNADYSLSPQGVSRVFDEGTNFSFKSKPEVPDPVKLSDNGMWANSGSKVGFELPDGTSINGFVQRRTPEGYEVGYLDPLTGRNGVKIVPFEGVTQPHQTVTPYSKMTVKDLREGAVVGIHVPGREPGGRYDGKIVGVDTKSGAVQVLYRDPNTGQEAIFVESMNHIVAKQFDGSRPAKHMDNMMTAPASLISDLPMGALRENQQVDVGITVNGSNVNAKVTEVISFEPGKKEYVVQYIDPNTGVLKEDLVKPGDLYNPFSVTDSGLLKSAIEVQSSVSVKSSTGESVNAQIIAVDSTSNTAKVSYLDLKTNQWNQEIVRFDELGKPKPEYATGITMDRDLTGLEFNISQVEPVRFEYKLDAQGRRINKQGGGYEKIKIGYENQRVWRDKDGNILEYRNDTKQSARVIQDKGNTVVVEYLVDPMNPSGKRGTMEVSKSDLSPLRISEVSPTNYEKKFGDVKYTGSASNTEFARFMEGQLYPREKIKVDDNSEVAIGKIFIPEGADGRQHVHLIVNVNGEKKLRTAYLSSSQGVWRLKPATNHIDGGTLMPHPENPGEYFWDTHGKPGYDKGEGEATLNLSPILQRELAKKSLIETPLEPKLSVHNPDHFNRVNETKTDFEYMQRLDPDYIGRPSQLIQDPKTGEYFDPKTNQRVVLEEVVYNPYTKQNEGRFSEERYDLDTGKMEVVSHQSKKVMSEDLHPGPRNISDFHNLQAETVSITGEKAPDFSKNPSISYENNMTFFKEEFVNGKLVSTPYTQKVMTETYLSVDGNYEYTINKTISKDGSPGKIWLASISSRDGSMTSHGVNSRAVEGGFLETPLFEYEAQTPRELWKDRTEKPSSNKICTWKFLKKTPFIQSYYTSKGLNISSIPDGCN